MDKNKVILKKLVIAPVDIRISVDSDFVRFIKDRWYRKNIMKKGDIHTCVMLGHTVPFEVVECFPEQGVLGDDTELVILPNPTHLSRKILKCYIFKPGEQTQFRYNETVFHMETVWKIVDGEKLPESLIVWTQQPPKTNDI